MMAAGRVPKRADWRVADGVRVEELDGSWLALDPAGGVVYRLEARAAEVMRLVAHRLPLPGHLIPAARELAGHGVLEHPLVDRRTALVGAGVVTLTGLAATMLPSAARAASVVWTAPGGTWPVSGGTVTTQLGTPDYYVHAFTSVGTGTLTVSDATAIRDVSILVVAGGGSGGAGNDGCGGGGGAGGVVHAIDDPANGAITILANGTYTATVGGGGAARANSGESGRGSNGSNSSFVAGGGGLTITVLGGGAGGGPNNQPPTSGGSGGGGGGDDPDDTSDEAAGVLTSGRANVWTGTGDKEFLGFAGGVGFNSSTAISRRGGGGGGASGAGSAVTGGAAMDLSARYQQFGDSGQFAGGGGGSAFNTSEATRGAGGGGGAGQGGYDASGNYSGGSGGANTGSGGGGAVRRQLGGTSGAGGSGVVLVRYRLR